MASFQGHLVGRVNEVAELSGLAESTRAGQGQAAFVVGEAGLGKTAVLEQAATAAERLGIRVLYGTARELEQQCPFAFISSCLRLDEASSDAPRVRAAEVLRGDARYGLPGAKSEVAGVDVATVEAMLGLVDDLCAHGPLALFLDDLQWADSASLTVLRKLVRSVHQLPLLVVGAYRPVPGAGEVDRLSRSPIAGCRALLELAPLDTPAVSVLLADLCGREAGPRLRHMAQSAAGNPLYITELVAALVREEAIETSEGIAEVSVGCPLPPLITLMTHRLRYLHDRVLQVLRVASVLGASCTTADLAAVLDMPVHDLLATVEEARASGILRDTGEHLRFRHDLIRDALYDAVPMSVRAMLHLKAAQALSGAGAAPERVAEHLLCGAPAGDFLITWLEGSAARLTTRAPAMALRLLTTALELADPTDARYGHLRLNHAMAQLSSGLLAEAEESARRALARTRDPGSGCLLRWIIIQAAFARGRPDLALSEVRAGCATPGVPPIEAVRLRAFSAVCLFALGKLSEAGAVASRARRAADEAGDGSALASVLHVLAAKRFLEMPDAEAVELARQASRLAPDTMHPAQWMGLQLALVNCYADLDMSPDARRTLAAVRTPAERTGGVFLPWYHLSCALLAFHAGRWDDALAEIEAGLDCGDQVAMSRALRAVAAVIAVRRGRQPVAEALLTASVPAVDNGTVASFYEYLPLCAGALLDEAQGDPGRAYARLAEAFDKGVGHLPGQLILCFLTPDLVRLAMARGDTANARRYAVAAQRRADHSGGLYHLGDAYRCQGLLTGDLDLLMESVRCYRNAPRPLNAAHACTDAAELLARRGRPDEARILLDQALETFTQLGAVWDAARATSRLRAVAVRSGSRRTRSGVRHGWDALTHTERLVAGHVAEGRSNPEIAARMSIARSTVSTHVSSILRKLAMTSRVELAAEVTRRQKRERPSS
ncbi:AAA family ATPase [Streptomyces sp. NBC_01142]|uniref:helix-turn-helix transcriptional regulator n=1 Tax=Streptomyces sp. NBC_01142 TaxID=2975865 RepID=UPI002257C09D|nr:LuxR family transcriptional regulator [Streptomyces sp. NBC_01142]MCX4825182.1 AAA family ATPase [Streptomyces sp. NBC_01142]